MNYLSIIGILTGALLFIFFTARRKSLTIDGAITATVLGFSIIFFAGIEWLIPLFYFFITGSLLSKLNAPNAIASDEKHGKGRDYVQVLCNGLPYAFLAAFAENLPLESLILMSVSIAIATSDTWSSEIGMYFRGTTIDILKLRKQPPGISGGISGVGTLGGFVGAISTAAICVFLISQKIDLFIIKEIEIFYVISGAGFLGMLLDSVIGSAFQIRYKNTDSGELSDTAFAENVRHSGFSWMTNDVVNLLSNIVGTGLASVWFLH